MKKGLHFWMISDDNIRIDTTAQLTAADAGDPSSTRSTLANALEFTS